MTKFKITYQHPDSGQLEGYDELFVEVKEFKDTASITAGEWAEDYAYNRANKGWYTVEKIDE